MFNKCLFLKTVRGILKNCSIFSNLETFMFSKNVLVFQKKSKSPKMFEFQQKVLLFKFVPNYIKCFLENVQEIQKRNLAKFVHNVIKYSSSKKCYKFQKMFTFCEICSQFLKNARVSDNV